MDPRPKPTLPRGKPKPPCAAAKPRGLPYGLVRVLLGLLLVVAGALKLYQLGFEAGDESDATFVLLIFAEVELLFGAWLVSGLDGGRTRALAAAAFVGLAASSLFQVMAGKCSCGCFGGLTVNPGFVLILDVAAVFAIVFARPSAATAWALDLEPLRVVGLGCLGLAIAAVGWRQADLVTLAGTATAAGRPMEEAEIVFTGPSGRISLRTDHDGRFRLPFVRPGHYAMSAPGRVLDPPPRPAKKTAKSAGNARTKALAPAPGGDAVRWIEIPQCSEYDHALEL